MFAPASPSPWRAPCLAIVLALAVGACEGAASDPTAVVRPPTPTPAPVGDAAPGGEAAPSANPTLIAAGPSVSLSVRAMNLAGRSDLDGADFRPGQWSPDGGALVAWQVVDTAAPEPVARAWLVAVPPADEDGQAPLPSPVWESGDVEGPLDARLEHMATWRGDGMLAVARSDQMLITVDGMPGPAIDGLGERQLRGLLPSPDGSQLLAYGPAGAWRIDASGRATVIDRVPEGGADGWAWRKDGDALSAASGLEVGIVDVVEGGPFEAIARADATGRSGDENDATSSVALTGAWEAPRWLADGTLFLGAPSPLAEDRAGYVYRVVDVDGTETVALPTQFGRDPSPVPVSDASTWVAPNGSAILVPEIVAGPDGPAVRASWLYGVVSRSARELPPMVDAVWSPEGSQLAWSEAGALLVRHLAEDRVAVLTPTGAAGSRRLAWSPDGRWLLYGGTSGDLWLGRADATSSPVRVAETVAWEPLGPTWSPASDRFAVAVRDREGGTRLVVAELPAE